VGKEAEGEEMSDHLISETEISALYHYTTKTNRQHELSGILRRGSLPTVGKYGCLCERCLAECPRRKLKGKK